MTNKFLATAKAWAALIGCLATAVLGVIGPDTRLGQLLSGVVAVATAVVVWRVPNRTVRHVVIHADDED